MMMPNVVKRSAFMKYWLALRIVCLYLIISATPRLSTVTVREVCELEAHWSRMTFDANLHRITRERLITMVSPPLAQHLAVGVYIYLYLKEKYL
jgi:hypothetical protein